ncbi:3-hydroxyacyl-CoA dehydrogenase NAD-binding domain-containing protein [Paraburkholderia sp. MM5477-R1]|uniref:3-hydroxyacyl-CoA dehydrogenase NAD-binding domain-containing protein n=1 Tax=Paraburkholderia sp. MM5477-R1 TaxID=2991062 RepID=UPI003D26208B
MESAYEVTDGVAVVTFDNPPVNSLSAAQRKKLHEQVLDAAAREHVKAIVVSGGALPFCGGAEIREFNTPAQKALPTMPELIEACDKLDKPVIAAISGFAFGAGLELAMAMHYRIATVDAKLGLPEVKFGFLPGAGGTQRLPRLMPMEHAAPLMLSGSPIGAPAALEYGLVDQLSQGDLLGDALAFARKLIADGAPLRRTSELRARLDTAPAGYFDTLRADIKKRSPGHKGKLYIVDCCEAAIEKSFEEGRQFERERFLELLETPESKALRYNFFAERQAAKIAGVAPDVRPRDIGRAAVIGAGTMGAGIAVCFANAGIPVALVDATPEGLERGMSIIREIYEGSVAKGRISTEARDRTLQLVTPVLDLAAAVSKADLVVEAVFERLDLKQQIFRELDRAAPPHAILATNTSMLDIDEIAAVTSRPQDVIGMHFFSPAHVMRLLEVVRCARTSDEVLVTLMQVARKLNKTAVLSRVCDGFIGNRMLQRYLQQALFLLDEGCSVEQIDSAMEQFGMAMGPLAVGDLSGLDIGWSIRKRRYVERPDMAYSRVADRICEAGRLGQKTGKGWYRYEPGSRKRFADPEVDAILDAYRKEIGVPKRDIAAAEIVDRLMLALINEGALILHEGVAQRASDIDVVYATGYGFPVTRGGPMHYANTLGLDTVLARMKQYQQGYQGSQWQPGALLVQLAQQGGRFE